MGDPVGLISGINIVEIPCDDVLSALLQTAAESLNIRTARGVIASGDQFIASAEKKKFIKDNFSAIACEMEGAAIGHVCYVNETPFAVVRAISDSADGEATMDYPTFLPIAARNSTELTLALVREY